MVRKADYKRIHAEARILPQHQNITSTDALGLQKLSL